MTGLYVAGPSDLDVVLFFPRRTEPFGRREQLELLARLARELRHEPRVADVALIEAKTPIVCFTVDGLVVDLAVQSCLGMANSSLVSRYTD